MEEKKKIDDRIERKRPIEALGPPTSVTPFLRWNWDYSGRYQLGKLPFAKMVLKRYPYGTIPPPTVNLKEPLYLAEKPIISRGKIDFKKTIAMELRIDIDRHEPLGVVSGTVTQIGRMVFVRDAVHFIGRVTSNKATAEGCSLVVEEFSLTWPGTGETIERLNIDLTPVLPSSTAPTAKATFITAGDREKGPYSLSRSSLYFHDVEVEVDREDSAAVPEPYNTHTHPNRPAGMPDVDLNFDWAYARAGINISRTVGGSNILNSDIAGPDLKWSEQELHDAMDDHWTRFANRTQWKMWVFLAEEAESYYTYGVMFDAYIDEPGGVDRQGCAVFTQCPWLLNELADDNTMPDEFVERERFLTMVHEAGHAFNLYHSWRKTAATPWNPPPWTPTADDNLAMSWMNYSWRASQRATGNMSSYNTDWFYDNFDFRFADDELMYLRHAPDRFVIMGGSEFGDDHGMMPHETLDRRLELVMRSRKSCFELGEPVTIELRLKNISEKDVMLNNDFDLQSDELKVAITDPQGQRKPFLPFIHVDRGPEPQLLAPGKAIYLPLNLVIGLAGCPFKIPGAYRIEASYPIPGGTAVASVMQLHIRQPSNVEDWPVINELFNARVGRVLYVGGSRGMEDVLERIKWVGKKLGKKHPAQFQIARALCAAHARPSKIIDMESQEIRLLQPDSELVARTLEPVIAQPDAAADSLGHIVYTNLVNAYVECTALLPKKDQAARALREMLKMYEKRKVVKTVIDKTKKRLEKIE